jgi:thiamine transport system substrate-binding protein
VRKLLNVLVASVLLAACAGPVASPSAVQPPSPGAATGSPAAGTSPAAATPTTGTSPGEPTPTITTAPSPTPGAPAELTLLTHDAFALTDTVIQAFERDHNATLKVLKAGDAGVMVNQAILSKSHPLADVLYGIDNTFLSRALTASIFDPYEAPALASVPAAFQLDPQDRVTPVDYADVCLNIDKSAFAGGKPPAPTGLADLTRAPYQGMLAVENPATSSPGLAFMLATIATFGETGSYTWLDYWKDLRANDVKVEASWNDAYETDFSAGAGKGDRPIVVSYASSPPAEVYYAPTPPADAPTAAILDGCFRQVEFVGVLAGTAQPDLARAFVDFMLSPAVQADLPLQMFVFPSVQGTPLPAVFTRYAKVPPTPLTIDSAAIAANRDRWIQEWTATVLR